MKLRPRFAAAIVAAMLVESIAFAQQPSPQNSPANVASEAAAKAAGNTTLASYGDVKITLADYEASLLRIPEQHRLGFAQSQERVGKQVEGLLKVRTFAHEAKRRGLDQDPIAPISMKLKAYEEEAKRKGLDQEPSFAVTKNLHSDWLLSELLLAKLLQDASLEFEQKRASFLQRAREQYLTSKSSFTSPREVKASHILVDTKTRTQEQALARINELRAQIAAGKPFEEVAESSSDDPAAKKNKGALGFFAAGQMDPDIEAAAFALTRPMEISGPVKGKYGYHIVRLEEIKPEKQKTFEEASDGLMDKLKMQHAETRRIQMLNAIYDPAKVAWNETAVIGLKKNVDSVFYQVPQK